MSPPGGTGPQAWAPPLGRSGGTWTLGCAIGGGAGGTQTPPVPRWGGTGSPSRGHLASGVPSWGGGGGAASPIGGCWASPPASGVPGVAGWGVAAVQWWPVGGCWGAAAPTRSLWLPLPPPDTHGHVPAAGAHRGAAPGWDPRCCRCHPGGHPRAQPPHPPRPLGPRLRLRLGETPRGGAPWGGGCSGGGFGGGGWGPY